MHDLRRKLLSLGNHFFERLKTANFSTACGTSTLKSPLSRESDAPHVHSRLRKRLSRCTLDCGFKTSESPALRGFVGGLRALATAALYLVLKSNGPHRSKNLPVKFGFSSKTVSANISKKLPPQRCPKPLLIAFFQLLAQMAHVRSHGRKWVHPRFCSEDRTQGHTRRNRGRFGWGWYHYSRSVPHVHQHPRAGYQNGKLCRFWALVGCAPEERRKPAGQRCAYARRCPEASRPRWAA